jgi:hypothetical protein
LLTLKLATVPPEGEPVRRQADRAECTDEEWALAGRLANYPFRLVVVSESATHNRLLAEVAHEAFLRSWPTLTRWLDEERAFLIFKSEAERKERLLSLIDGFSSRRVLVLGDLIADEFIYGEVARVSREAPVLILKYDATEIVAGGAGNAANNVATLGGRARLVGLVGADPEGRRLLASFHRGVDRADVVRVREYRTPVKTRILAGGAHSAKQQVVRIDRDTASLSEAVSRAFAKKERGPKKTPADHHAVKHKLCNRIRHFSGHHGVNTPFLAGKTEADFLHFLNICTVGTSPFSTARKRHTPAPCRSWYIPRLACKKSLHACWVERTMAETMNDER